MSREAKNTRTKIADLPEGLSVLSAEEMQRVVGGFFNVVRGFNMRGPLSGSTSGGATLASSGAADWQPTDND